MFKSKLVFGQYWNYQGVKMFWSSLISDRRAFLPHLRAHSVAHIDFKKLHGKEYAISSLIRITRSLRLTNASISTLRLSRLSFEAVRKRSARIILRSSLTKQVARMTKIIQKLKPLRKLWVLRSSDTRTKSQPCGRTSYITSRP